MKRVVKVKTDSIEIVATIDTGKNGGLMLHEVDGVRNDVADKLMNLAASVRYLGCPLNKVKVR